jgi:hypothetical protein
MDVVKAEQRAWMYDAASDEIVTDRAKMIDMLVLYAAGLATFGERVKMANYSPYTVNVHQDARDFLQTVISGDRKRHVFHSILGDLWRGCVKRGLAHEG